LATTRVYILAKELGVKSKAIVEKCQAEGLDVKNHMATISAGLAATIREWFSEGEHATTVEASTKVDLKKVRIKKKKVRKTTKKKAAPKRKKKAQTEATAIVEQKPEVKKARPTRKKKAKKIAAKPEAVIKAKPKPIAPAGPKLEKPKPAKLSGPRVVRVEAPEPQKPARPARPKARPKSEKPRYDEPITELLMQGEQGVVESLMAKPGKAKRVDKSRRGKEHPRRQETIYEEELKRPKLSRRVRQRDLEERRARLDAAVGERFRLRPSRKVETRHPSETPAHLRPEKVTVSEPITVKELSAALAVKTADIIGKLMQQGIMATANQTIATDIAELIALDFGTELVIEKRMLLEEQIQAEFENRQRKNPQKRCPVVTMLGHVDHGKTSLLDRIRYSNVVADEAGGITQHIGAYQISQGDRRLTFLDTPGHEAFTAMRARGANMTDVVVLVVAADDGVMPQTVEAINHAKAAGVPIIVALNKIDLPGCDLNRIYGQLAEHELAPAQWGGKTEVVETSAVTGEGIDNLLEHLDYISELLETGNWMDRRSPDDTPAGTAGHGFD